MTNTQQNVSVTLKFFDPKKQYGFLVDGQDASKDVFFHFKMLKKYGFLQSDLTDKVELLVDIKTKSDGKRQVLVIHSIGDKLATEPNKKPTRKKVVSKKPARTRLLPVGSQVTAAVKFYDTDKGFGFLEIIGNAVADDMSDVADVFFHISSVPEYFQELVEVGAVFDVVIEKNAKGLKAVVQQLHQGRFSTSDAIAA